MKRVLSFVLICCMISLAPSFAQDCKVFFPDEMGKKRIMTSYDHKDKKTGKVLQEILEVNSSGPGLEMLVKSVIWDKDDELVSEGEMEIGCRNGVFTVDMSDYLREMLAAYESMEVQLTGDDLSFPPGLNPGDMLPDGTMNIKVINNGMTIMNMDVSITNRKVEAKEVMETPAGKFDCFKITYDTVAKTRILTITTSGTEWISENVGMVRTESFNKKGKLTSYSVLTSLE